MRHPEVAAHQELELPGLGVRQPQTLGRRFGDPLADDAVVFFVPLPQVVQQERKVQLPLLLNLPRHGAQAILAIEEPRRLLHGADAVLVDRELVVLVELQQAPRVGELGDHLLKRPQVVQPPQQPAELRRVVQDLQEPLAGRVAERRAVLRRRAVDQVPRVLADPPIAQAGEVNQAERLVEPRHQLRATRLRGGDLTGVQAVVAFDVPPEHGANDRRHRRRGRSQVRHPRGEEPDMPGVAEVVPHELLDRQHAVAAVVGHLLRQPDLLTTVEGVVLFARVEVHVVADPQQELPRRGQPAVVELRQHALAAQPVEVADAGVDEPQPTQQVQVAEPAA